MINFRIYGMQAAATGLLLLGAPSLSLAHPGGVPADSAEASTPKADGATEQVAPTVETASELPELPSPAMPQLRPLAGGQVSLLGPGGVKQWGTQQVAPPAAAPTADSGPTLPNYVGKIGFGFHNFDTPLGMRMWLSESFGFDVGVGANFSGVFDDGVPSWGVAVEGAILLALVRLENMIVFLRGGLQVDFDDRGESDDRLAFDFEGMLGIEYFLTALGLPNLSLSAGLSLGFNLTWEEDTEQFSYNLFTSVRDFDLVETASLGFHFYF